MLPPDCEVRGEGGGLSSMLGVDIFALRLCRFGIQGRRGGSLRCHNGGSCLVEESGPGDDVSVELCVTQHFATCGRDGEGEGVMGGGGEERERGG